MIGIGPFITIPLLMSALGGRLEQRINRSDCRIGIVRTATAASVLALTFLACRAGTRPAEQPQPETQQYTKRDSAALAALDSFLLARRSRPACPMPVVRGDSSHDSGMVLKLSPEGWVELLGLLAPCYNPLFKVEKAARLD